jgi:hypothetical protein
MGAVVLYLSAIFAFANCEIDGTALDAVGLGCLECIVRRE